MYKCLPIERFDDTDGYSMIPLRQEDMESIRVWRNAQIDILRQQTPIESEQQKKYFINSILPTFEMEQPPQILFSFLHNNKLIGYGGLTHIDWIARRAEISFLLDPPRNHYPKKFQIDFRHFLAMLMKITFKELKLHRLFAETYAFRSEIMLPLEELGFRLEGRMREHVFKRGEWMDSLIHGIVDREAKRYVT